MYLACSGRSVNICLMDVAINLELEIQSAPNRFTLGVAAPSSEPRAVLAYSWHSIDAFTYSCCTSDTQRLIDNGCLLNECFNRRITRPSHPAPKPRTCGTEVLQCGERWLCLDQTQPDWICFAVSLGSCPLLPWLVCSAI